jgi:hypothetical protein
MLHRSARPDLSAGGHVCELEAASSRRSAARLLCALFLASATIDVVLARALGTLGILSGEESSVSLRDPLFLELRRQYESICTNIAAHIFYWFGQQLTPVPSLFFGRYEKAVVMSVVPVLVAAYLGRQRGVSHGVALGTASLLALMPGYFLFAPLATEYGLECVTGMAALWLACSQRAGMRWLAAPLASWSALTYGAGLAFLPAVVLQVIASERAHGVGPRAARALGWLLGFGAPWLVPFAIWKNHPHLLTGGGTISDLPTLWHHLGQLGWESSLRGGSYYYFASYPALSQPGIAASALAAILVLCARREHAPVVVGWSAAVGIYLLSGREIGMRRAVPIVVLSLLALGLAWPVLRGALSRVRRNVVLVRGAVAVSFAVGAAEYAGSVAHFSSGQWRPPLDFAFRILPGKTMSETFQHLLKHPDQITDAYEPERTWAGLRFLARKSARAESSGTRSPDVPWSGSAAPSPDARSR